MTFQYGDLKDFDEDGKDLHNKNFDDMTIDFNLLCSFTANVTRDQILNIRKQRL